MIYVYIPWSILYSYRNKKQARDHTSINDTDTNTHTHHRHGRRHTHSYTYTQTTTHRHTTNTDTHTRTQTLSVNECELPTTPMTWFLHTRLSPLLTWLNHWSVPIYEFWGVCVGWGCLCPEEWQWRRRQTMQRECRWRHTKGTERTTNWWPRLLQQLLSLRSPATGHTGSSISSNDLLVRRPIHRRTT